MIDVYKRHGILAQLCVLNKYTRYAQKAGIIGIENKIFENKILENKIYSEMSNCCKIFRGYDCIKCAKCVVSAILP